MVRHLALVALLATTSATLSQASIIVPGTSDPWLAGMPAGSTASLFDVAPAQSPVEYTGLPPFGSYLYFIVTGSTDHCDFGGCGLAGPDGDALEPVASHSTGAENGLSDITAPIDSLIGVFLGPGQPDAFPAPAALNFSTAASRDFTYLNPELRQIFFIGDGQGTADGQFFAVPAGATRLFLGTMDGFGWFNNVGGFEVEILNFDREGLVPEPASLLLFGAAAILSTRLARRRRRVR